MGCMFDMKRTHSHSSTHLHRWIPSDYHCWIVYGLAYMNLSHSWILLFLMLCHDAISACICITLLAFLKLICRPQYLEWRISVQISKVLLVHEGRSQILLRKMARWSNYRIEYLQVALKITIHLMY